MILALILSWQVVTIDCIGGPESVNHYELRVQHIRLLEYIIDAEGNAQPVYSEREPVFLSVYDTHAHISEYSLGVGDVVYYNVDAIDGAFNSSVDCP